MSDLAQALRDFVLLFERTFGSTKSGSASRPTINS
jgi:hypothetical protein